MDDNKFRFPLDAIAIDPSAMQEWLGTVKFNDADHGIISTPFRPCSSITCEKPAMTGRWVIAEKNRRSPTGETAVAIIGVRPVVSGPNE